MTEDEKAQKEAHEIPIGNHFLKTLKLHGKLIRHGKDDGVSDLIYSLRDRTVGIEISTAYYGEGPASVEWKIARGKTNALGKYPLDSRQKRWEKGEFLANPNKAARASPHTSIGLFT